MGLLVTRARSAFGLLTAAGLTLLLAATAVCVAVLYAQSVSQAGLAALLGAASPQERALRDVLLRIAAADASLEAGDHEGVLRVQPDGRPFLRNAAALFDAYVGADRSTQPVYSRSI